MTGLLACLIAFLGCFVSASRGLVPGIGAVLATGYAYGLVRANFPVTMSHFIFDAGVAGLYLACLVYPEITARQSPTPAAVGLWVALLSGWAVLVGIVPMQSPLVTLVGLRANVWLLPVLLLGSRLKTVDLEGIARYVAALNLVALGFAAAEFVLGVERFYPENPVTALIYRSNDVAGYTALRIPAMFVNAHVFAGTMVVSVCLLAGVLLTREHRSVAANVLLASGLFAAYVGVLMASTRLNIVLLVLVTAAALVAREVSFRHRALVACAAVLIGLLAAREPRFQRIFSLTESGVVSSRIGTSLNASLWDLIVQNPIGTGLGSGGTSMPYFLQQQVRNQAVGLESEYSRLVLELGIPGLLLWIGFAAWVGTLFFHINKGSWATGNRLMWLISIALFGTATIGGGLMTSIPQSFLLFLFIGWLGAQREVVPAVRPVQHAVRERVLWA